MRARSAIWVRGLAIVSTKTRRVSGRSAAATLATSVALTNVIGIPWAASVPNRLLVLPNRKWLATTWSPSRSSASRAAPIAAIPVAKQTVATPSSMAVTFASRAADVGFPWRPYA
jgi:hypothetical protein